VQEPTETAERVLEAAARLFSVKGFANVSVRDICRETGISAPVLYYHFGNKKGLFDAVARRQIPMGDLISKLTKASGAPDPEKALASFIRVYLTSFPEHGFYPGLYLRDSATLDKHSAEMASHDLERIRQIALGIVKRGVDSGAFRGADREFATDCLLGMLNRVIFQHIHFSKVFDREAYTRFVTDFFLRAMGAG
jgi:AcrR family transcriptional regulator